MVSSDFTEYYAEFRRLHEKYPLTKTEEDRLAFLIELLRAVNKLIDYGVVPEIAFLKVYVTFNEIELVKELFKHGVDPNVVIYDKNGYTYPIMHIRSEEMLKLFYKYGANLNVQNNIGYTPLINIILNLDIYNFDKLPMIAYLLKRGADPDILTNNNKTALMICKEKIKAHPNSRPELDFYEITAVFLKNSGAADTWGKPYNIKKESDDICAICLGELNNGQPIIMHSCTAQFHEQCVNESFSRKMYNCPICRNNFGKRKLKNSKN